jgi:aminoglycoside phosphotransferase (APT) family kinase protein
LVEFKGRHGIVFERIDGISLLKQVQTKPWTLFAAAQQFAELHAYIHTNVAPPELPPQRQLLKRWIEAAEGVSANQRQAAHDRLNQIPDANMLCHGDFHADSTILTKRGPIIIDWMTASRGYPLADVARTSAIFEGAHLPREMGLVIRFLFRGSRQLLHAAYLKRYLQLQSGTRNEINSWRIVQKVAMSTGRRSSTAWPVEREIPSSK